MEAQGMGLYPACWHCGSVNKRSLLNMRRPMTWVELPAKTCLLAVFDEVVKTGWMGKQRGTTGCKLRTKQLAVFLTKRKITVAGVNLDGNYGSIRTSLANGKAAA